MAAACNCRDDCRSGARRIPRCATSHGPARHAEDGDFACAGLSTRDGDTTGCTRVGAALVRVRITRGTFTTIAVIRAGITRVAATGTEVTRNNIAASRTALFRATDTCRCIPVRRHTSRSIAEPSPRSSCATKHGGPAQRPNCDRQCRNRHASFAARATCRFCACSAESTRTKP
jgi:hypothetical protein